MKRTRWGAVATAPVLATLGAFAACQTPTSMTVVVSTDVDCSVLGGHLAHVVAGASATVVSELAPSTTKTCDAAGEVGSVVLLPSDDESIEVGIKVVLGVDRDTSVCGTITDDSKGATDDEKAWSGCIIARRRLAFIEGEALTVEVPLNVSCIGVPCSDAAFTTCVKGGRCVPGDVDPDDCLAGGCGEDDLPETVSSAAVGSTSGSAGEGGAQPTGSSSEGGGPSSASSGGEGGDGGHGAGGGPDCRDASECDEPADPCRRAECVDGACTDLPEIEGAACGDGRVCRADGACVDCLQVNQCGPLGECRAGLVCTAAGECQDQPADDGAPCVGGTCQDGACELLLHCTDGDFDPGVETDFNCGAECPPCDVNEACVDDDDCQTHLCESLVCTECDDDDDCDLDQHCASGVCEEDGDDGVDCDLAAGGSDCLSGYCLPGGAGGVCCDQPCTGVCMGCGDGSCDPLPLPATPPGCLQDACSNGCNADGTCARESTDFLCDGPTCDDGTTTRIFCDGYGACQLTVPEDCSPNICDGDTCGDGCNGPSECVPEAQCLGGECTLGCDDDNPCPVQTCKTVACTAGECVYDDQPDGTDCGSRCEPGNKTAVRAVCTSGSCGETTVDCCQYKCDPTSDACFTSCNGDSDCDGGVCTNPGPGGSCAGGFVSILPGECTIIDGETP